MDCLFCKIVAGEIPCSKVYEDEFVMAFNDISPIAPTHILIIPKQHIASLAEVTDTSIVEKIAAVAIKLAKERGLVDGYRLVTNIGKDGQQSVAHLHFHLIGGKPLDPRIA